MKNNNKIELREMKINRYKKMKKELTDYEIYNNATDCLLEFSTKQISKERFKKIMMENFNNKNIPLLNERYGTMLALALETNSYIAALELIDNHEELGIDLNIVSSFLDGSNAIDAKTCFRMSLFLLDLNYDEHKINSSNRKYEQANAIACRSIAKLFLEKEFFQNIEVSVKKMIH